MVSYTVILILQSKDLYIYLPFVKLLTAIENFHVLVAFRPFLRVTRWLAMARGGRQAK